MSTRRDRDANGHRRELIVTPPKLITAADLMRQQEQAREAGAAEATRIDTTPAPTVAVAISAIYDGWPLVISTALAPARIPAYLARLAERGYVRPPQPIPGPAR